jgi:hypothetical protein
MTSHVLRPLWASIVIAGAVLAAVATPARASSGGTQPIFTEQVL